MGKKWKKKSIHFALRRVLEASRPIHIERDIHQSMRIGKPDPEAERPKGRAPEPGTCGSPVKDSGASRPSGPRGNGAARCRSKDRRTRADPRSPNLGRRPQSTRGSRGPGNRVRQVVPGRGRPRRGAGQDCLGLRAPRGSALGWFGTGRPEGGSLHGVLVRRCSHGKPAAGTRKGSCTWRTGRREAGGLTSAGGSAAEPSGIDRGPFWGPRPDLDRVPGPHCEGVVNDLIGRFGQRWSTLRWLPQGRSSRTVGDGTGTHGPERRPGGHPHRG